MRSEIAVVMVMRPRGRSGLRACLDPPMLRRAGDE
jgi:hypothetical protein